MSGSQPNGEVQGQPDDAEPSLERQTELRERYEKNVAEGKPPYEQELILGKDELLWIIHERHWADNIVSDYPRPDFRSAHLADMNLSRTDLLYQADLRRTVFDNVNLSHANLMGACLEGAYLEQQNMAHAVCANANLMYAQLNGAHLNKAVFDNADLTGAQLNGARLVGASFIEARMCKCMLILANLTRAVLNRADLSRADLRDANLSHAGLTEATLTDARLHQADLTGCSFYRTRLDGVDLSEARMDVTTLLAETILSPSIQVADVIWNGAPLTRIAWDELPRLGDEMIARQRIGKSGETKDSVVQLAEYQAAARSYRQLAVALRDQGLNEDADRYAYRAQLMQRVVLRRQAFLLRKDRHVSLGYRLRKLAVYVWSGFLDLIAGYGYRPGRSLLAYVFIILTFAGLYLLNGQFAAPHLRWDEALVLSVSSFHGRGFFTTDIHLGDTLARLAVGEAIVGLLIEITFIATFTQRFFSR